MVERCGARGGVASSFMWRYVAVRRAACLCATRAACQSMYATRCCVQRWVYRAERDHRRSEHCAAWFDVASRLVRALLSRRNAIIFSGLA